jgi:hypothetical protein
VARRAPIRPAKKSAPRAASARVTATFGVIFLAALAALAPPLCLLVVVGLLPTVAALVLDRHKAFYLTRTVGAMNLAATTFPALALWDVGVSMAGLHQVLGNPLSWLAMYGGASLGWLLYLAIPPVAGLWIEVQADDLRRRLAARAKALVEEWGEEVTGRPRAGS